MIIQSPTYRVAKYHLLTDLEIVKAISKESFSVVVQKAVTRISLESLKAECAGLKKTAPLKYTLELQEYLSVLYPSHAKIIYQNGGPKCLT